MNEPVTKDQLQSVGVSESTIEALDEYPSAFEDASVPQPYTLTTSDKRMMLDGLASQINSRVQALFKILEDNDWCLKYTKDTGWVVFQNKLDAAGQKIATGNTPFEAITQALLK